MKPSPVSSEGLSSQDPIPSQDSISSQGGRRRNRMPARVLLAAFSAALLLAFAVAPSTVAAQEETAGPLAAEVDAGADASLADSLERRYAQIEELSGIQVESAAGVVTLRGEVLSERDRDEAVQLAQRVEGVARVEDRIEVVVDPRKRLRPALDQALDRLRHLLSYVPLFLICILLVAFFLFLARFVGGRDFLFQRIGSNRFARDLAKQVVQAVIVLTGILVALEILDATALVGAVLGTAGVIGLALGFAFKDLVENYISSILLSLRQPFAPNEHVVIDGQEGKVVRLTSRATILMTLDGNHLRIPNSQVFKGVVLNYSRNPKRRFDFGVGVGVGEDLMEAQRLGIEALGRLPGILDDPPPLALIEELGESNVLVRFYGWVDQDEASFFKVKSEAIRQVKTVLEDAGMDLPEPIYRVHMVDPSTHPPAKAEATQPTSAPTAPADISPGDSVDEQIAEERARAGEGEKDLLDEAAPTE